MIRLKHILTEQRMAPWELLGPAAGSLVRQTIQSKVDAIDKQFQDTMNPLYQLKTRLGFAKGQLKINRFVMAKTYTGLKMSGTSHYKLYFMMTGQYIAAEVQAEMEKSNATTIGSVDSQNERYISSIEYTAPDTTRFQQVLRLQIDTALDNAMYFKSITNDPFSTDHTETLRKLGYTSTEDSEALRQEVLNRLMGYINNSGILNDIQTWHTKQREMHQNILQKQAKTGAPKWRSGAYKALQTYFS